MTKVEYARDDYEGNNWGHGYRKRGCKEKFGSYTRNTFNRFNTIDCYAWNITNKL